MSEQATLGGGCFWCVEAVFDQVRGVTAVVSGYAGGHSDSPTYREVCNGTTGHAEVVQITFDPAIVSYREILEIFFVTHDPTTLNRQGADDGTQYRSVVFYHDEQQKKTTEEVMASLREQQVWRNPIVTQLDSLPKFYPAEDYHQGYYRANPGQGYCRAVIEPKVVKFRQKFVKLLKG